MKSITALEIYNILSGANGILDKDGEITFTLNEVSFTVKNRNIIGNILEDWLKNWLKTNGFDFTPQEGQEWPDFFLNQKKGTKQLLEIKAFDYERSPNFDIANFDAYCRSIVDHPYRLDADYLIFGYAMSNDGKITVKKIWLKKVWEISGNSDAYPIKVQQKQKTIYNIRPILWYAKKQHYSQFNSKLNFLIALKKTLDKYPKTKDKDNNEWFNTVRINYLKKVGKKLI